ncbi:MAG TPA: HAMP domain-containing sensor histidine kinase [Puia sp.]
MNKNVLFFILLVGGMTGIRIVHAQAPDLSRLPDYRSRMKALVEYCEQLRLNKDGSKNNFVLLKQEGAEGLQMTQADDADTRAKFYTYMALGNYYEIKFDSAQYYFYQSLYEGQKAHLARPVLRACVSLIPVNFQLQQLDKVNECKSILQSIVDTTHDRSMLEDGYYALGSYYQQKSYYTTAQDYFIKSIQLRENEVDTVADQKKKFDFAIQCDMLSKLYLNTEMVDKSLEALRKGQRFAAVSPNVGNRLLSSFVEAFTSSGKIDSALYYDEALEKNVSNPMQFPSEIVSSDLNIAIYYINHKQYPHAFTYIQKGDILSAKTQAPLLIFQVQMIKGRWLAENGRADAAISELTKSMPVARQLNKELYANDLKYMALALKKKGDMKASLDYYEQYQQTTDSLNKEKMSNTFADLETRYQTNEKEQRIASLGKENRLNMLELESESHTRMQLVLGLVALGIISLLLFLFYRNKEKLNQQLSEANETKTRLFGIISHDLRGPVGKIVSLLQLQKQRPDLFGSSEREKHEERLKKASENVLETMEDLLLWSKSQMQNFTPDLRPVRIGDTVQKEVNLLQEQLNERSVRVDSRVPASFTKETDENFLSIIIRNLLQNAMKHSEEGKTITIDANSRELTIVNPATEISIVSLNARLEHTGVDSKESGLGLQITADLATRIKAKVFFRQDTPSTVTAVLQWEKG